ncbi:MAG: deacetylase sulfotransferase [Porticoccaceae bacterium]|nr:MAG: deacetylase sulfotransferase [Porticoccaceae bacterium]
MSQTPHDFLVVGVQKGGTTALHHYLDLHPDILLPRAKELHFFDDERRWKGLHCLSGIGFYNCLAERDPARLAWLAARHSSGEAVKGEITPIYLYWQPCLARIQRYHRAIRLVVLLRNPIERAISHYRMERARGNESLPLLSALLRERERLASQPLAQHRIFSYVHRGFYSLQLERLWRFFPREQTLVCLSEELEGARTETLNRICRFLGVSPIYDATLAPFLTPRHRSTLPLEPSQEALTLLARIFAPEIRRLERLLERSLDHWLRAPLSQ